MYASKGGIDSKYVSLVKCNLFASYGQNGGGVVFNEQETLFAIYSAYVEDPDASKKLSMCIRITPDVVDFVDNIAE